MSDVAARANVSPTAVSFALNDPARLSSQTVAHILSVADEMGYVRNTAARMLRTQRTNSLGLLLPQPLDEILANPYYTQFLRGIGKTCQREGYTLLLVPPLRGSMLKAIPYAAVDGFVISGLEVDRGEISAMRRRKVPFVLVDSEPLEGVPSVEIDEEEAMGSVAEHVLDLGHRRIGVLAFESGLPSGEATWRGPLARRMAGIRRAIEKRGLEDEVTLDVREVPCDREGGVAGFRALWDADERPTAIITFSDVIAFGVLDAAAESGVDVPGELSVTGFDDLPESRWARPALTTLRQSIETKARIAADRLIEELNGGAPATHERLHAALVVRDSTARLA